MQNIPRYLIFIHSRVALCPHSIYSSSEADFDYIEKERDERNPSKNLYFLGYEVLIRAIPERNLTTGREYDRKLIKKIQLIGNTQIIQIMGQIGISSGISVTWRLIFIEIS